MWCQARPEVAGKPIFLLGVSLGGHVALHYTRQCKQAACVEARSQSRLHSCTHRLFLLSRVRQTRHCWSGVVVPYRDAGQRSHSSTHHRRIRTIIRVLSTRSAVFASSMNILCSIQAVDLLATTLGSCFLNSPLQRGQAVVAGPTSKRTPSTLESRWRIMAGTNSLRAFVWLLIAYLCVVFMHGRLRIATGFGILHSVQALEKQLHLLMTPMLIQHGRFDRIASVTGSELLYEKAASADKELIIYEVSC